VARDEHTKPDPEGEQSPQITQVSRAVSARSTRPLTDVGAVEVIRQR
jgi:hypothetical protein